MHKTDNVTGNQEINPDTINRMNICIPLKEDNGLESAISGHFGRAPFHYIVNTQTGEAELLAKSEGEHGQCVPAHTFIERKVDVVLCMGMGRGAAMSFSSAGIPVMQTTAATLKEAWAQFEAKKLVQMSEDDLCAGHGHDHSHGHEAAT